MGTSRPYTYDDTSTKSNLVMRLSEKLSRFKTLAVASMAVCLMVYLLIMLYVQSSSSHSMKSSEKPLVGYVPWLGTIPARILSCTIREHSLHSVDDKFLSFTIDSSQIRKGLMHPSLGDEKLRRTLKHLGGGYIRFGGTAADLLVFSPGFRTVPEQEIMTDGSKCAYDFECPATSSLKNTNKFSMSAENWKAINTFARAINMKLLFDLNVLLPNHSGGWNSSNAELILDISNSYQYNIDWELGNEPNAFMHVFGSAVPPKNLSADFKTLRALLNTYVLYNASLLVGPDVTNPRKFIPHIGYEPDVYLSEFLDAGDHVNAVTWHHYYTGPNVTLEDYLNVDTYNSLVAACRRMINVVKLRSPQKPIWLGETGSSYGGGAPRLSDRFVASLLWTDKLGVAAREGISIVMRQSVYAGHYALLGEELRPNPDYWVSALHKHLVGKKVLNISCSDADYDSQLRVYAHCSNDEKFTVFGVNIANDFLGLNLRMNTTANLYSLSSSLSSKHVYLNGYQLRLLINLDLPEFLPVVVNANDSVPIPPLSIFFLRVNAHLPACVA